MKVLINLLISTLVIIIAAYLLPGVKVQDLATALVAALVIGVINAFIRPILILLTLPINILTLGLFTLVLNALLIQLASSIVAGFTVDNFLWALIFSVVLSVINSLLHQLFRS